MSDEILMGAMVEVPKAKLTNREVEQIVTDLRFEASGGDMFKFGQGGKNDVILLWGETETHFSLPRAYVSSQMTRLLPAIKDVTTEGNPVEFFWSDAVHRQRSEEKGRLDWYELQVKWVDEVYTALLASPSHGVIGQAPTAFGKSACSAKVMSKIGRPALVIVHRDFLLEQWRKDLAKWLNIDAEKDIGIVQGPVCEYEGKKVVIAMVESLAMKDDYHRRFMTILD